MASSKSVQHVKLAGNLRVASCQFRLHLPFTGQVAQAQDNGTAGGASKRFHVTAGAGFQASS